VETQNITVSLSKALVKKVKIVAAKRDTSVSALLASSLEEIVRQDDRYDRAARRLVGRARKGYDLGSSGQVDVERQELHER
jgi:predicted transcriptional regulator